MTFLAQKNGTTKRLTHKLVEANKAKGLYPYVYPNPDYKKGSGNSRTAIAWHSITDTEVVADVRIFHSGDIVLYRGPLIKGHKDKSIFIPYHIYRVNCVFHISDNYISLHRAGNIETALYLSPQIDTTHVQHVDPILFQQRKKKLWEIKFINVLIQKLKDHYGFENVNTTWPINDLKRAYILARLASEPKTMLNCRANLRTLLQVENDIECLFDALWDSDTLRLVDEVYDMAIA